MTHRRLKLKMAKTDLLVFALKSSLNAHNSQRQHLSESAVLASPSESSPRFSLLPNPAVASFTILLTYNPGLS